MENIRDFFTGPPHPSSAYPTESSSLVFFLDKAMVSKILTGAIHYILTENEGAKALRPGNSKIYICQRDPSRTLRLIFVPKTVVINLPKEVARAFAQPGGVTPIEFDLFFRNANYLHLILINHNNLKETSTPFSELVPDVEIGHFQRSWAFKHSRLYSDYAFSCEEGLEEASEEKAEELEAAPPEARAGEEVLGNVSDEKIEELLEEGCLAEPREASKERVEEGGRKPEGEKDEEKEPMASTPVVRKSKELQAREKRTLRETTLDEFFH